ncbi:reverse transcriptase domain-containing protein [Tanacetum coccineum]|uniref:Reverse transcriptase domain-containing protein n=1 Tax=Tanacetum coccineum TaxID=301880 RepID=A0ABQ4XYZ4_9ASTR
MHAAPEEKEELIIYLAAARKTVSAVLMIEREAKQMPIYFVSRALRGLEVNYTSMENLVLAFVQASKRLKRYFQAHPIIVITDQPIKQVLSKPEVENRIRRICYTLQTQDIHGSGVGLILTSPKDMEFTYALRFGFEATNNEAEYEELIIDMVQYLEKVLVEELKEKLINKVEVLEIIEEEGETWMTPIHDYITGGILPAEADRARAVKHKAQPYSVVNGILYKKSFLGPWLRCVGPLQANYVLREIHEGSYSMHADTRSVVSKALQIGYYWPTIHKDARELIWACKDCHVNRPIPRNPQQKLNPITSLFGLPGEIILDNGKQFRDNPFKDWCEKLSIHQRFASVKHPQTNGLVERANRSLGEEIKARLEAKSKDWMEEISHVLWAYRTMIKSSNGDTPFSLTYKTEAVIPTEIGMPTIRTAKVDVVRNDEALEVNLDLLKERREQAAIREAKSKRKQEKYYNMKVRSTSFKPGDLVYRNNDASNAEKGGKLGPKKEGPY